MWVSVSEVSLYEGVRVDSLRLCGCPCLLSPFVWVSVSVSLCVGVRVCCLLLCGCPCLLSSFVWVSVSVVSLCVGVRVGSLPL